MNLFSARINKAKAKPNKVKPEDYQRWKLSSAAQRMLALESAWLRHQVGQLPGHHLLYHGLDSHEYNSQQYNSAWLDSSPIAHTIIMGMNWQKGIITPAAWVMSDAWPFADQSLDVVVLQHSLEFTQRPHQMIREATRVLSPDGSLVITGFNPWSWWGLSRALLPFSNTMLAKANSISLGRLKDWLILLDYSLEECVSTGYLWPLTVLPAELSLQIDQKMTSQALMMGGLYKIVAKKNTLGITHFPFKRWPAGAAEFNWSSPLVKQPNRNL